MGRNQSRLKGVLNVRYLPMVAVALLLFLVYVGYRQNASSLTAYSAEATRSSAINAVISGRSSGATLPAGPQQGVMVSPSLIRPNPTQPAIQLHEAPAQSEMVQPAPTMAPIVIRVESVQASPIPPVATPSTLAEMAGIAPEEVVSGLRSVYTADFDKLQNNMRAIVYVFGSISLLICVWGIYAVVRSNRPRPVPATAQTTRPAIAPANTGAAPVTNRANTGARLVNTGAKSVNTGANRSPNTPNTGAAGGVPGRIGGTRVLVPSPTRASWPLPSANGVGEEEDVLEWVSPVAAGHRAQGLTAVAVSFPISPPRLLTEAEASAVSEMWHGGQSKTAICRRVYGSKNSVNWGMLQRSMEKFGIEW